MHLLILPCQSVKPHAVVTQELLSGFSYCDHIKGAGRPKLCWEDGVGQDMRILGVKNWKKVALNRDKWA